MSTASARIVIVGGGLAGLVAAWRLQQRGVTDVVLFEARAHLGGRIQSVDGDGGTVDPALAALDRFDLGPTWFWPRMQPELDRLVEELGLERFAQFDHAAMLVERTPHEAPLRMAGYASEPASMRLVGGTGALIAALMQRIVPGCVRAGHTVCRMHRADGAVELEVRGPSSELTAWHADHVLLALPPRLAERRIAFDPPLEPALARSWRATPTWMAPHAKYVAVYDTAFWREQGLSGAVRSGHGPMVEIHDASMLGGFAALFGFLGVPARVRQDVADDVLHAHCRAQLSRLFGEQAARPRADALKDWARDPLTATEEDQEAIGHHAAAPPTGARGGVWQGCLTGIGSEWSAQFAGYLAGAVDAAEAGVRQLVQKVPGLTEERTR
jgi:monoamine oxidase